MRLIDAEYLEELIAESYGMTELDGVRAGYSIARILIDKCPTINPVKEKARGYWKQRADKDWSGGGAVVCSACGYGFSYGGYANAVETFLYCPACGARMENGGNG